MNNIVSLGLSTGYISHWGLWEAIRELLQNAVDQEDYTIDYNPEYQSLKITSYGGKMGREHLLLGNSSKRDDNTKVGSFGEGLKLSMLVLLREGYTFTLHNGVEEWIPFIGVDDVVKSECLQVQIIPNFSDTTDQVEITIGGIDEDSYESEIKNKFLPLKDDYEVITEHSLGRVILEDTPCVYVNGLFVCELESNGDQYYRYSYDFKPDAIVLDRDRQTADTYYVTTYATRMLREGKKWKELVELANDECLDLSNYETGSVNDNQENLKDVLDKTSKVKWGDTHIPINNYKNYDTRQLEAKNIRDMGKIPVEVSPVLYNIVEKSGVIDTEVVGRKPKSISTLLDELIVDFEDELSVELKERLEDIMNESYIRHG